MNIFKGLILAGMMITGTMLASGPVEAQDNSNQPHHNELASMEMSPLVGDGPSYRLIWHAWHRRPGALTLSCDQRRCTAELRHTDGYGTYQQGTLAFNQTRTVRHERALQVIAAMQTHGVFGLKPDLPVDGNSYLRPGHGNNICLHAPNFYIEARHGPQSVLAYRFCQDDYESSIATVRPLIDLFTELFPREMSQVSQYSDLESSNNRLREIE